MEQLILHLFGDYVLQNQWITNNKIQNNLKGYLISFLHAVIYSIPFLIFLTTWEAWLIILISHFFIDKYQFAKHWVKIMNFRNKNYMVVNNGIRIVIDNCFHLICNYFAILLFS